MEDIGRATCDSRDCAIGSCRLQCRLGKDKRRIAAFDDLAKQRLVAKKPDDRYASAQEALEALMDYSMSEARNPAIA